MFSQYCHQRCSRTPGSALISARAPQQSSLPCYCLYPHPSPSRRPPEREWSRPARSSSPAASQTVRTLSKTVEESRPHCFGCLTHPESLLLHSEENCLFTHLADFFEIFTVLMTEVWTVLADMTWDWPSFLTFSCQSFSSSTAISAMEAFAVRFLWSATAVSSTSPLDKCIYLHSRQGLVMVDLLDNFLNPLKLSWLWQAISQNCHVGEWIE